MPCRTTDTEDYIRSGGRRRTADRHRLIPPGRYRRSRSPVSSYALAPMGFVAWGSGGVKVASHSTPQVWRGTPLAIGPPDLSAPSLPLLRRPPATPDSGG